MAQIWLAQEDLKAFDQLRQRLFHLANNIGSLKTDLQREVPLPEWSSIETSSTILSNNIKSIAEHLTTHADLLQRTVVYPQTNFPGRTQEPLLGQLLRKKAEPQIETWVEEGRAAIPEDGPEADQDLEHIWSWASEWVGDRVVKYAMDEAGEEYTAEEREQGIENVNTGLRRDFEEESDEDEDEDEEMENGGQEKKAVAPELKKNPDGKVRTLEEILKFGTRGVVTNR